MKLIEVTTGEDRERRYIEASDNLGDEAVALYLAAREERLAREWVDANALSLIKAARG